MKSSLTKEEKEEAKLIIEQYVEAKRKYEKLLTKPGSPWNKRNKYREGPGDICCQRSCGKRCTEHDPASYLD